MIFYPHFFSFICMVFLKSLVFRADGFSILKWRLYVHKLGITEIEIRLLSFLVVLMNVRHTYYTK